MDETSKKYLIRTVLGLLALLVLILIWRHLHTGHILITTDNSNYTITVSKIDNSSGVIEDEPAAEGKGSLDASVASGTYAVMIRDRKFYVANKTLVVPGGKTTEYDFDTPPLKRIEPVLGMTAVDIAADSTQLRYLDSEMDHLSLIDTKNNIIADASGQEFDTVKWVDTTYGVGQDTEGNVYEISGGNIRRLSFDNSAKPSVSSQYAVANDRRIYVSIGQDIYSGYGDKKLSKIYKTDIGSPLIFGAADKFIIINADRGVDSEPGSDNKPDVPEAYVEVVSSDGKLIKRKNMEANSAAWSADGKKVALIDYSGGSRIYDSNLDLQTTLPTGDIVSAVWKDSDKLFYITTDRLWSFNTKDGVSTSLGEVYKGEANELSVSKDGDYVYVVVSSTESSYVGRVGLDGQVADDYVYDLNTYLPVFLDYCTASLVNFTAPTVLLRTYSQAGNDACLQSAKLSLQNYDLDFSKLGFQFGPMLSTDHEQH